MSWNVNEPDWQRKQIPNEETSFTHLFAGMDGWESPTGHWSIVMACIAMYSRMKRVVELGVQKGGTSACLAHAMKVTGGLAVGIDIGECAEARDRIRRLGLEKWWAFIHADTHTIDYDRVPIDLLFIDAGHEGDACEQDWNKWTQWVPPGGLVFIDNTVSHAAIRHWLVRHLANANTQLEWQAITVQKNFGMAMFRRKFPGEVSRMMEGLEDR